MMAIQFPWTTPMHAMRFHQGFFLLYFPTLDCLSPGADQN